jgi:hypothetical protein
MLLAIIIVKYNIRDTDWVVFFYKISDINIITTIIIIVIIIAIKIISLKTLLVVGAG